MKPTVRDQVCENQSIKQGDNLMQELRGKIRIIPIEFAGSIESALIQAHRFTRNTAVFMLTAMILYVAHNPSISNRLTETEQRVGRTINRSLPSIIYIAVGFWGASKAVPFLAKQEEH